MQNTDYWTERNRIDPLVETTREGMALCWGRQTSALEKRITIINLIYLKQKAQKDCDGMLISLWTELIQVVHKNLLRQLAEPETHQSTGDKYVPPKW